MKWLNVGLRLLPLIVGAVEMVERFIKAVKGKPKEDAAVAMLAAILQAVEAGADKDLLKDEEVENATRAVMQAIVALQNVIARKNG